VDRYQQTQTNNGILKVVGSLGILGTGCGLGYIIGGWQGLLIGAGASGIVIGGITIFL
jgi:hypothetical protein